MRLLVAGLLMLFVFVNTASALVWFTVSRHVQTAFTAAEFDNAMTDVNNRLRIDNDRCSDVPCTATFQRSGNVNTFGTVGDGLDVVTTAAELATVFAQPERAKVVTILDYCGGYDPSIVGCGTCNGFGFVLETGTWNTGNVYVHEYGHNVMGCGHRDNCTGNIMHSITTGTNDSVNATECVAFSGKVNTQLCGNVYDGSGGPLTTSGGPYWVTCTVTVPSGQTLTIQPGVEIQFKHDNKITVTGALNADGTTSRIFMFSNASGNPSMKIDKQMKLMNGGQILLH